MINKQRSDLILGKRYWLDKLEDVSGVFIGLDEIEHVRFNDIKGVDCYLQDSEGIVGFGNGATGFRLTENDKA